MIHHQACTGGTLISRCVAAIRSVVLLHELSPAGATPGLRFDPISPLTQLYATYPQFRPDEAGMARAMGAQLAEILAMVSERDLNLVIRDHSHSCWMIAGATERNWILDAVSRFDLVRRVVTVRHPFYSHRACVKAGWHAGFRGYQDYCQRYLRFLDSMGDAPVIRYEDFVREPAVQLTAIAAALDLGEIGTALIDWQKMRFTGNSGRSGELRTIRTAPVEDWDAEQEAMVGAIPEHAMLCERLGYPRPLAAYVVEQNRLSMSHDPLDLRAAATIRAASAFLASGRAGALAAKPA